MLLSSFPPQTKFFLLWLKAIHLPEMSGHFLFPPQTKFLFGASKPHTDFLSEADIYLVLPGKGHVPMPHELTDYPHVLLFLSLFKPF